MPTFVQLCDLHVGLETTYDISKSKFISTPTHDLKFFNKVLECVRDLKPDITILGGDQLDQFGVSRFNKDSKIGQVEESQIEQYDIFNEKFLKPLEEVGTSIVWLQGNHDDRIVEFLKTKPQLQGLVEPWAYLNLKTRALVKNRGEAYRLGKLWFVHGDNIPSSGDIAKAAANQYHRNIRFGHFHTYRAYTMFSPVDTKDVKTAIAVPALTNRSAGWANNKPNTCLQGFNYGEVSKSGNFTDKVVIRTPDGFEVNNTWYRV